ncbi:MAG: 30S ribosomal protein S4 [Gemmataceae bacterium]
MARNTDPVCKMCRREGLKLYLKGSRCESPKCPIERKRATPGMHGFRRGKLGEYAIRLREKQKLKRFYGVLELQFRGYFAAAARSKQNTGEALLSTLERRLDNVVHRLGFAPSRAAARQVVAHGHIQVNGHRCTIASQQLKPNDVVKVKPRNKSLQLVKLNLQTYPQPIPDFLEMLNNDPPEARVIRLPSRGDVDPRLNRDKELQEQLIIEFCSR